MAPTPQHSSESSCLTSSNTESSSVNITASSKVQKISSSTSSTVSNNSSNSSTSLNSNNSNKTSGENGITTLEWPASLQDSLLPITSRGLFNHDSFFEDSRKHFDQAVKEVLDQWGQRSHQLDDFASYRKLREEDLQEHNQAVSVSQDETTHKVVLDVRDFMNGDVKVKVIDETELVVEGNGEKQENGSVSKKSFRRSFTFPGLVKSEAISSAMSSDGVLTVTVPKKNINQSRDSSNLISNEFKTTQRSSKSSSVHGTQVELGHNTKEDSLNFMSSLNESDTNNVLTDSPFESLLPVSEKGMFFQDDFFASVRQDFESAVKEVLGKWEETTSITDEMTSYRNLRNRNLRKENQAVSTSEDHQCHKVVMDVQDFMHNDLKVKVVDENELVVEGNVEKKDGGSTSKKSFKRSFIFPGLVKSESVSSAMSSDGVLTITVPKREQENASKRVHFAKNENLDTSEASQKVSSSESTCKNSLHFLQENSAKKSTSHLNEIEKTSLGNNLKKFEKENLLSNSQRGHFFQDDFFSTAQQDFENTAKKVFNQWEGSTSSRNEINIFKSLQERTPKYDENQAASITEDHRSHKVAIRVGEFQEGDLQVKAVDQNQLLVEGRLEKEEGGKSSTKSFSRRVQLPGALLVDDISCGLSNGVLTITAPKDFQSS